MCSTNPNEFSRYETYIYSTLENKRVILSYATIRFLHIPDVGLCTNFGCTGKSSACAHRNYELAY